MISYIFHLYTSFFSNLLKNYTASVQSIVAAVI